MTSTAKLVRDFGDKPESRVFGSSLDRIEAEARGELEWLEARQRRNLEVRERLKWVRRCLRLIEELRDARA